MNRSSWIALAVLAPLIALTAAGSFYYRTPGTEEQTHFRQWIFCGDLARQERASSWASDFQRAALAAEADRNEADARFHQQLYEQAQAQRIARQEVWLGLSGLAAVSLIGILLYHRPATPATPAWSPNNASPNPPGPAR